MRILIAGPWVGEFGWELLCWHSYMRSLSKFVDKTICLSKNSSKHLYTDFCDEFLEYKVSGVADGWKNTGFDLEKDINYVKSLVANCLNNQNDIMWIPPMRAAQTIGSTYHHHSEPMILPVRENNEINHIKMAPTFTVLGENQEEKEYDYIIHARGRNDIRPEDNWSIENWNNLIKVLKAGNRKVACIGTKNASLLPEGADDLRDEPLDIVTRHLNNAICTFGPSSGAMHLASLCNSPHVVWANTYNKKRYTNFWNPHKTPVLFLDKHKFQPTVDYVIEKFTEWDREIICND